MTATQALLHPRSKNPDQIAQGSHAGIFEHNRAYVRYLQLNNWISYIRPVNELLKHLKRRTRSESTKENYCYHLYRFCNFTSLDPNQLVKLSRDRAERLVQSYGDMLNEKKSPRYGNVGMWALKAFFRSNGFKREKELEIDRFVVPRRTRVTQEYIPTKAEIFRMSDHAGSLKARAIILFIFATGFRNSSICALRYSDLWEELEKGILNPKVSIYPAMKEINENACKNLIEYYCFLFEEAREALQLYLGDRTTRLGEIELEMPLFNSDCRRIPLSNRNYAFLTDRELRRIVKLAAKRAGITQWRYVKVNSVRKAFESVLHSAMSDGESLDIKVQTFWMGHLLPGSDDNYFDRDKVEEMRSLYSKLRFIRVTIENKFTVIQNAVRAAFAGTNIDAEQAIVEYVKTKHPRALGAKEAR